MNQFLKKNILLILVFLFGYSAYALASSYARPNGTTQYVGGGKAVGPAVDADFNSLVSWLNGNNLSSVNILAGGIAQSNLAAGSVGPTQLGTANLVVSASSGAYYLISTTTGNNDAQVLSVSATVTGTRPIFVRLEPAPASYVLSGVTLWGSFIAHASANAPYPAQSIFVIKDGATTAALTFPNGMLGAIVSEIGQQSLPCNALSYVDSASSGTHTWALVVDPGPTVSSSYGQMWVYNCRLVVEEM